MKITVTLFLIALFGVGFFHSAHADIDPEIYAQSTDTTSGATTTLTGSGPIIWQKLGNGLTGNVTSVQIERSLSANGNYQIYLYSCDAENARPFQGCTGATPNQSDSMAQLLGDKTIWIYTFTNTISLDPTKYYYIVITSGTSKWYGSSGDNWTGGDCKLYSGGSDGTCGPLDLYFQLNGTQTYQDTSYTGLEIPANLATTTSSTVLFQFYAHPKTGDNIDRYKMPFYDQTTGTTFNITGNFSGGNQVVSKTLTLSLGHLYSWQAFIGNANGNYFSGGQSFAVFVGATTTPTIGTTNSTTSPSGQTELAKDLSDQNLPSCLFLNSNNPLMLLLSQKFPFSYLFDFCNLVAELYTTPVTNSLSIEPTAFNYAGKNSYGTSTSLTVIDQSNATTTKITDLFRTPIRYAMWFLFALAAPNMIASAF